eukprot:GHVR01127991.1.p1 GENE.GHVR01127991.1~~GHVR01127991.1.p1  ORF type:complete len:109 (+),score=45.72 GHVR01127991.1:275-601(+)
MQSLLMTLRVPVECDAVDSYTHPHTHTHTHTQIHRESSLVLLETNKQADSQNGVCPETCCLSDSAVSMMQYKDEQINSLQSKLCDAEEKTLKLEGLVWKQSEQLLSPF